MPLSQYTSQGFSVVYHGTYATNGTTTSILDNIKAGCSTSSIICATGYGSANPDILITIACGNCLSILGNQTALNVPRLVDGVYWHYTDGRSFGFSPSPKIKQVAGDTVDLNCTQRLSWHLISGLYGYRLGSLAALNGNPRYHKLILRK